MRLGRRLGIREFLVSETLRFIGGDSQAFAALLFVSVEVSFAPVDVSIPFEGEDMGCDSVEEPAVVGDHDDAAREIEDGFFKGA